MKKLINYTFESVPARARYVRIGTQTCTPVSTRTIRAFIYQRLKTKVG